MRILFAAAIILFMALAVGCSGDNQIMSSPDIGGIERYSPSATSHCLWGLWQGVINPEACTIGFTELRTGVMHLNALPFLEPPALVNLTLESLKFNGDIIDADIGLRHPFLGLTEFTGFDVCGIFIANGSISGFADSKIIMAGANDTRLLNPDSYSRWWNPSEFPHGNTIGSYKDGLLGAPDSIADYNSTVNAYKYFCDDLTANDSLGKVTLAKRGIFSAGQKNIRHYTIKLGAGGLVFNYAVDASWEFPQGTKPWTAPGSFGPNANRTEAWRISVGEIENTLWNDGSKNGGDLKLRIDVYDWFNAGLNKVRIESPSNFAMAESVTPIGTGMGYSTYEIDILNATPTPGQIELLISVICEKENFEGFIPGTNTTAYFTHSVLVGNKPPATYHWEFDAIVTFTGVHSSVPLASEFNQWSPALIEESDGDIGLTWCGDDGNDVDPGIRGIDWVRRSTDNGVTYGYETWRSWSVNTYARPDVKKISAGSLANAYGTGKYSGGENYSDIVRIETEAVENRAVLLSQYADNLEIIVDHLGYIYGFDDAGNNIQVIHSLTPESLSPNFWNQSPYKAFTVAAASSLSHSRSTAMDSSNVLWLAYYDNAQKQIRLARTTDASPHQAWDSSTVVYTAGPNISQVKDPSLWIDDDDIFHICYTRFGMLTGLYELVYTRDDASFDNPAEQVIFGTPGSINDVHISVGKKFGKQVVIIIYENNKSIYLVTIVGGVTQGPPQQIDNNTDDIDPDAILDADECDFHSVWATMHGNNYDIARRNGVLVED